MCDYPYTLSELTPEWFSKVMNRQVESFESKRLGEGQGYLSEVYRIKFSPVIPDAIGSVVIKLPNTMGLASPVDFYSLELIYYDLILKKEHESAIPAPTVYYVGLNPNDKKFILVMEDFDAPYSVGDQVRGLDAAEMFEALGHLAKFHAKWWKNTGEFYEKIDQKRTSTSLIQQFGNLIGFCWDGAKSYMEREQGPIDPIFQSVADFLLEHGKSLLIEKITLIHGDFRPDNMMVWRGDENTTLRKFCAIDFQCMHEGHPMEDVTYILGNGCTVDVRRKYEKEFLLHYHKTLVENGVTDYPEDKLWADYQEFLVYNVLLPVLSAAKLDGEKGATEFSDAQQRGKDLMKSWLERTSASIIDNDPTSILPTLAEKAKANQKEEKYPELENGIKGIMGYLDTSIIDYSKITVAEYQEKMELNARSGADNYVKESVGIKQVIEVDSPRMTIYLPSNPPENHKVIVYFPYNLVGASFYDMPARKFCSSTGNTVVYIHYGLAPENKQPQLLQNALSAFKWIVQSSSDIISKFESIILLSEQQGSHLAVSFLKTLHENNLLDKVSGQILVCPWMDSSCSSDSFQIGDRYISVSGISQSKWVYDKYIDSNYSANIFDTIKEFRHPATLIFTAEFDVARSEGLEYLKQLKENGTKVEHREDPGTLNLSYVFIFSGPKSETTMNTINDFIKSI